MTFKRNLFWGTLFLLLAGLFFAGLYHLFDLRFDDGSFYPPYSTFRTDPQGAKIFFQALEELPDLSVRRQLKTSAEEPDHSETQFFLGAKSRSVFSSFDETIRADMELGHRVVIAFRPVDPLREKREKDDKDEEEDEDACDKEAEDDGEEHDPETCSTCKKETIIAEWGVQFDRFVKDDFSETNAVEMAMPEGGEGLAGIPWHSALYFKEPGEQWQVLYRYHGEAVVIERTWEQGTVVLLADSYVFSNEAMIRDRHTTLLARLVGPNNQIVFDEIHLGVRSSEGVMMLVHRYRLQGILVALLILAGLFVWKSSSSLVPVYVDPSDQSDDLNAEINSMQGFNNLLVRHIPKKQLVDLLIAEWRDTFSRNATMSQRTEHMDEELEEINAEPVRPPAVELYNRLTKSVNERK